MCKFNRVKKCYRNSNNSGQLKQRLKKLKLHIDIKYFVLNMLLNVGLSRCGRPLGWCSIARHRIIS